MVACNLYSSLLGRIGFLEEYSPTSTVTTIVGESLPRTVMRNFVTGSALVYKDSLALSEVMALTLLNPSPPPPPGPSPPPPAFGFISGSVTRADQTFTFSVTLGSVVPDALFYAFFTTDGIVVQNIMSQDTGNPSTMVLNLDASVVPFVSYAQVVALKFSGGSSNVLTLKW